jgi:hypothetical protein
LLAILKRSRFPLAARSRACKLDSFRRRAGQALHESSLFAGSERAGRRAAAIQSLLATAKLNGLEPLRWLTETLKKLPTGPNSQIASLLPFAKPGK